MVMMSMDGGRWGGGGGADGLELEKDMKKFKNKIKFEKYVMWLSVQHVNVCRGLAQKRIKGENETESGFVVVKDLYK